MKQESEKYFDQLSQKILDKVSKYEYRKKQRKQIAVSIGIPIVIILFVVGALVKTYEPNSSDDNVLYAEIENYLAESTNEYELYYDLQENPEQKTISEDAVADYLIDDVDLDYELFQTE